MPETRTAMDVRTATLAKQLVIERVFDAFTNSEKLTKWCRPKGFSYPHRLVMSGRAVNDEQLDKLEQLLVNY